MGTSTFLIAITPCMSLLISRISNPLPLDLAFHFFRQGAPFRFHGRSPLLACHEFPFLPLPIFRFPAGQLTIFPSDYSFQS